MGKEICSGDQHHTVWKVVGFIKIMVDYELQFQHFDRYDLYN